MEITDKAFNPNRLQIASCPFVHLNPLFQFLSAKNTLVIKKCQEICGVSEIGATTPLFRHLQEYEQVYQTVHNRKGEMCE